MRTILVSILLLAVAALPATAQTGMNLAWNNCITQGNAAADIVYVCDGSQNGTPFKIVFSFFASTALPQFVGLEATLDFRTSESSLPDWWRLGSGECREGNLGFPGGLAAIGTGSTGACRNPWSGAHTGGGLQWTSNTEPGAGRLRVVFARDAETALSIDQQYVGGVITLDTTKDIDAGDGLCTGCTVPVCVALTEIQLSQTAGAPGGDLLVISSAQSRNFITWQGGAIAGGCPGGQAPPQLTWGSIRALMR